MDYKSKRMASAKGIKRVAAAAASAMLIGTSVPATVIAAVAPQVALAYGEGDIFGYTIGGIMITRCASDTKRMTYTFGSGDDAVVVNVDFTNNPEGTQTYTYKGQTYDNGNDLFDLMGTEDFTRAELYTKQNAYKPVKVIIVSGDDRDKQRLETAVISDDGKVTFTPIKDTEGWNYCNYEVVWGVNESYPADFKATHGTVKFLTEDSPKAPVAETHNTLSGFTAAVPIADEGYHFVGWTKAPTGDSDALPENMSGEILTIDQLRDASCDNAAGTTYTAVFAANQYDVSVNLDGGAATYLVNGTPTALPATISRASGSGTTLTQDAFGKQNVIGDATVTKSGWSFGGWQVRVGNELVIKPTLDELTSYVDAASGTASGSSIQVPVNAVWTKGAPVNITYSANGPEGSGKVTGPDGKTAVTSAAKDSDLIDVTATPAEGYKFVGWATPDKDGKVLKENVFSDKAILTVDDQLDHLMKSPTDKNVSVDTTFAAIFEAETDMVDVSFDVNGATIKGGKVNPYDALELDAKASSQSTYPASTFNNNFLAPDGYQFAGWNAKEDGFDLVINTGADGVLSSGALKAIKAAGGKVTLYAKFVPAEGNYLLTYKAGKGGTVTAHTSEGVIAAPEFRDLQKGGVFTRNTVSATPAAGYHFVGWKYNGIKDSNLKASLSAEDIWDKLTKTSGKISADGTFQAEFAANDYTVVFTPNGGAGKDVTLKIKAHEPMAGFSVPTFEREGYEFLGYASSADATEAEFKADMTKEQADQEFGGTEDGAKTVLYAVWKAKTPAEKSEAYKTLEKAVEHAEKIDLSVYIERSTEDFKAALKSAKDLLATDNPSDDDLTAAFKALIVGEGKLVAPVPGMKTGWKSEGGNWFYYIEGSKVENGWACVDGDWYYFGADGVMVDGWRYIEGEWYFFQQEHDGHFGRMCSGWLWSAGHWYYLSEKHDGSFGRMLTGWQFVNGKWYYLYEAAGSPKGACAVSTITPDGYVVDATGAWVA